MSFVPSDPEVTAIESALGALVPARSRLARDRLLFRAGQVASRPRWTWPSVAALLAVVALTESLLLAARPAVRVVERPVVVREIPPEPVVILSQAPPLPVPETGPAWSLASEPLRVHRQVLRFGIDALPESPLLTRSGVATTPESPGIWHRFDYQKALDPGGPS